MSTRRPNHQITETRDWAKIVLACGVSLSLIVLAVQGEFSPAVIASAAGLLR